MTEADDEGLAMRHRLWKWAGFGIGIGAAVAMAVLFLVGGFATNSVLGSSSGLFDQLGVPLLFALFGVGVTQLFWIVPIGGVAVFFPKSRGFALGLVVGAAIVFMLNAACFGVVLSNLNGSF